MKIRKRHAEKSDYKAKKKQNKRERKPLENKRRNTEHGTATNDSGGLHKRRAIKRKVTNFLVAGNGPT